MEIKERRQLAEYISTLEEMSDGMDIDLISDQFSKEGMTRLVRMVNTLDACIVTMKGIIRS